MQTIIARWPAPHHLPLAVSPPAPPQLPLAPARREGNTTAPRPLLAALMRRVPAPPPPRRRLGTLNDLVLIASTIGFGTCLTILAVVVFGIRHGWWA